MRRTLSTVLLLFALLGAPAAWATFHTYQIDELFSTADGTVQYVVLHEVFGANGQNFLSGHTLTSTSGGATQTFTFPNDVGTGMSDGYGGMYQMPTAFTRILIATEGFAALKLVAPDYLYCSPSVNSVSRDFGVDVA